MSFEWREQKGYEGGINFKKSNSIAVNTGIGRGCVVLKIAL